MKTIQKIRGTVHNVTFRNMDGWAVFSVKGDDLISTHHGHTTSCTGTIPDIIDVGHDVICEGIFTKNKYGKQLKCSSVIPAPIDNKTNKGVIRLLSLLPGVGKIKATTAVKELGAVVAWRAAQECPSYLLNTSNYEKALDIQDKAKSLIANYGTVIYFLGLGLTENRSNKIIKQYGENAKEQVLTDPYQLIEDISGFGFRIVDGIALKAGIRADSEKRILACIFFCLNDNEKNQGNVWFNGKFLIKMVIGELTESAMAQEARAPEYSTVKKLIYQLGKSGRVYIDGAKIYSVDLLRAEKKIQGLVR